MSVLFRGNLEEGNYTLIKTTDGWVLKGETSYVGFNFADRPQEWIPCSERLPKKFINVLVYLTDGSMDVVKLTDYIDIDGEPKWCHSTAHTLGGAILNKDVAAWMPLPSPWKGADDE